VVDGNYAQRYGGGLLVGGAVALIGSTISGNSTHGDGGGMKLVHGGTLTNSTVSGNTAQRGGGIYSAAGYHVAMQPLALVGSTISGNGANGGGPRGGGIFSRYGGLYLSDTTLAGNTSDAYGGGIYIRTNTAPVVLTHVTIAANSALVRGGGIMIGTSDVGTVTSKGSLFTFFGSPSSGGGNVAVTIGGIAIDGIGNLVFGDGLVNVAFANAPATGDPLLGALADNGGPTLTMLPGTGSPAIDAFPADAGACPAPIDQRGIQRPQGEGCDIGAVERILDRIFADGFDGVAAPSAGAAF
jgi:hypothetical protein